MQRFPRPVRLPGSLSRASGALLVAAGLMLTSLGVHAPQAAADPYDIGAPTLLSVSLDAPDSLVTFRDNSSIEGGYRIHACSMPGHVCGNRTDLPAVPGQGRVKTATVGGLQPNTRYCFQVWALDQDRIAASPFSNEVCADPPAPAPGPAQSDPSPRPSPVETKAGDGTCLVCPGSNIFGMPSHFSGQRVNWGSGTVVLLTWDPVSAASFYQLRAVSHQDGKTSLDVGAGASDIGAAKAVVTVNGKQLTGFLADGTATSVPGGADYYLSACSAPSQCGGEAMVFVPGP